MCSQSSFMTQESLVLDLSDHSSRQRHTLHTFPASNFRSVPDRPQTFYQSSSLRFRFDHEDDEDMTDDEEEQSLLKPLINAQNNSSPAPRADVLPVPFRTHRPQLSQTVTILDEPDQPAVPFTQQLTMSQFDLQQSQNYQTRAKLRHEAWQSQQKSSNSRKVLEKVCNWSRYSQPRREQPKKRASIKRVNSLSRRKDFSTRDEMASFAKSGNFVFHRGFSLRRPPHAAQKSNYRNRTELTSVMDYINPESTVAADFTSSTRFMVMQLKPPAFWQVLRLHPKFIFRTLTSKPHCQTSLRNTQPQKSRQHKNSIRRQSPLRMRISTVRRSKSHPGPYRYSSSQLQNKQLYDVWKHYLMDVIVQRAKFRLYLTNSTSQSSAFFSASSSLTTPSDEDYFPSESSAAGTSYNRNSRYRVNENRSVKSFRLSNEIASLSSSEGVRYIPSMRKVS
ncbi:LANO_0H08152g1_1 [Lachancea nothofagi CBS 11611]|uniref:LANO_0H08152g1_1 n=1 Tax=Lachancea nothofagi CBS 11611 TaxID=1266666 RepID=A0A1G4KLZ7_9SACH|nr:LANO_0H08152g1_1 [Lachancea nothofagi CBS 11611]